MILLSLVLGCAAAAPGDSGRAETGAPDTHTADSDTADTDPPILEWLATEERTTGGVAARLGWRVVRRGDPSEVCDVYASYAGGVPSAEPCPECDWAFDVTISGGTVTGGLCSSLAGGAPSSYTAWLPHAAYVTGFGWGDSYSVEAGGNVQTTTENFWLRYETPGSDAWVHLAYNDAGAGVYRVAGDSTRSEVVDFCVYAADCSGG